MVVAPSLVAVSSVKKAFVKLASSVTSFKDERPGVAGLGKFYSRLHKEIASAVELERQLQTSALNPQIVVNRLQGLKNNLRGLSAEFQTAKRVPGLIGVSCTFPLRPSGTCKETYTGPKSVEVDIVAQEGHLWVEVKDSEDFGMGSSRWSGKQGHLSGLKQQAEMRLQAAQLPQNSRRWRTVNILFHFPSGVSAEVQAALTDLGVLVSTIHPPEPSCLPIPPPAPTITNLDVTTLCAICSEVTNGGLHRPEVQAWAFKASHLRDSLVAEEEAPLLKELKPFLAHDRRLLVAQEAVAQFETLLQGFAGPNEKARWSTLKQRLEIFASQDPAAQAQRVNTLDKVASLTQAHLSVLSLGDAMRAVTLTANSRGVHAAASQGVFLEAFTHRPAWLAGL